MSGQNILLHQYPIVHNSNEVHHGNAIPFSTASSEGFNLPSNNHHPFHENVVSRQIHSIGMYFS